MDDGRTDSGRWYSPAMKLRLIFLLILIPAGILQAQTRNVIITVSDLHDVCKPALELVDSVSEQRGPEEAVQIVRCFGYVEGVVSAVIRLSVAGFMIDPLYEGTFCFPETTEPRNWIESFVAWAEDNPEKLETPAVDGFLLALIDAFPCDGSVASTPPADSP